MSPEGLYYTMGRHDIVAIVEAPNDETIASVLYSTGSLGNIRTETLSIFNVRSSYLNDDRILHSYASSLDMY